MANYLSRMFTENDKKELNDLYNLVANRRRTLDVFDWEWIKPPAGQGSMWLIIEEKNGKIIGHHGLIPIPSIYFGQSILLGKTENTVMHPAYRGQRIYFPFEKKFLADAAKRFDINYTISGTAEQGRIRLKLGYKIIGGYERYYKCGSYKNLSCLLRDIIEKRIHRNSVALVLGFLCKVLIPFLKLTIRKAPEIVQGISLEKVDDLLTVSEEWQNFWDNNRDSFGITIDRTVSYLQWRLFANPAVKYDFYIARRSSKIIGAVTIKHSNEGKVAIIEDLVAEGNDEIKFNSILQSIVQEMMKQNISIISFSVLGSNKSMGSRLAKNGFKSTKLFYASFKKLAEKTFFHDG